MATPKNTKQWVLKNRPTGLAILGDGEDATFKLVTAPIAPLNAGQVLLKTIYTSNDPAQRNWISNLATSEMSYVPFINIGAPMLAWGLAEVVETRTDSLTKGTMVSTFTNWVEYSVQDAKDCRIVRPIPGISITHHLGALGVTGLTAYYGLVEIARVKSSDTVVISGAAGATGSMAIQVAKKILGCKKVIGIAGTDAKCHMVERLGGDKCLNYKSPSFEQGLIDATENLVDVFFDNVGGHILDLMLSRMAKYGRVAQSGAISQYNSTTEPLVLMNFIDIIKRRVSILGFIAIDYMDKLPEVTELYKQAIKDGKLELSDETETVIETEFEGIPSLWLKLYEGINSGKLITKLK